MVSETFLICLWFTGVAVGLFIGWLSWRVPYLNAKGWGDDIKESGCCVRGGRIAVCERLPDGYCARCHAESYP